MNRAMHWGSGVRGFARGLAGLVSVLLSLSAWAQVTEVASVESVRQSVVQTAHHWLQQAVKAVSQDAPLRIEVEVGRLDPQLRIEACARIEPYLPPATRLWGKTRLGLRCLEGVKRWNVFLPVTVRAWGPAWVLKAPMTSGQTLSEDDVMVSEVDWAEFSSPVLARKEDWLGKVTTSALMPGQALRQSMVRAPQVFRAGAQVRVIARGPGFEISTSALAVSPGVVGESVRVRISNGQVITGLVQDAQTVTVSL
ncbi:MAG: flagellar basal body P-ring formation chaperone FlgA [Rhodoferax sp.]